MTYLEQYLTSFNNTKKEYFPTRNDNSHYPYTGLQGRTSHTNDVNLEEDRSSDQLSIGRRPKERL